MAKDAKEKFELPRRRFSDGPKRLFSVRLPEPLLAEIERIAKERQWDLSEVVITALDEFAQWERKSPKAK
jgi:metal-responsive CopG/Arc/MetJ family transcriptional regulator